MSKLNIRLAIGVLALGMLTAPFALAAQTQSAEVKLIDPVDTPMYVREGINGSHLADRYEIRKITYSAQGGKMAYDIEFDRPDGPNPRIRIFENETFFSELPPQDTPN